MFERVIPMFERVIRNGECGFKEELTPTKYWKQDKVELSPSMAVKSEYSDEKGLSRQAKPL